MTERWRKRLGDLDRQSPSEDLFERAKGGPQLPDEPISRPSTSTRVVTGVAAFLVFALAISVFAIPALRLKGGSGPASLGSTMQPLWPWRTIDEVRAWEADPYPVGYTGTGDFEQAEWTAMAFGREVLGWGDEVYAHERGEPQTFPCYDYFSQGPSNSTDLCSISYGGGASEGPTVMPYAPTTAVPAFRTFDLSTCPPITACDYLPPGPGSASVVVYQPLGGDGPWAVLEAKSANLRLSTTAGQTIDQGTSFSATGQIPTGYEAALAMHVGSSSDDSDCDFSISGGFTSSPPPSGEQGIDFVRGVDASLDAIDLADAAGRCQGDEPGFVYVVVAEDRATVDGVIADPLRNSGRAIYEFVAVPVVVEFPAPGATSTSASVSPIEWTTYTDPLGWTIDVPKTWVTIPIDGSDSRLTYQGAAFGSAQPEQGPGGPGALDPAPGEAVLLLYHTEGGPVEAPLDDTDIPPQDGVAEEGGWVDFRANGITFRLLIRYADNVPTPEYVAVFKRMIHSISFAPWESGDERNGWTALFSTDQDNPADRAAKISWQTCDQKGCYVLVYGGDPYVLGPIETCGEGENMTADATSQYPIVLECPSDPTQSWTETGVPAPGNRPGDDHQLAKHPVITSWDGTLLTKLGTVIG